MVTLAVNKPLRTDQPVQLIENRLAPGRYRFRLVVIDDSSLASEPAELVVTVTEGPVRPVRPLDPIIGRVTPLGPIR